MVQLGCHEGGDGNGKEDCRGLKDRRAVGKKRGGGRFTQRADRDAP